MSRACPASSQRRRAGTDRVGAAAAVHGAASTRKAGVSVSTAVAVPTTARAHAAASSGCPWAAPSSPAALAAPDRSEDDPQAEETRQEGVRAVGAGDAAEQLGRENEREWCSRRRSPPPRADRARSGRGTWRARPRAGPPGRARRSASHGPAGSRTPLRRAGTTAPRPCRRADRRRAGRPASRARGRGPGGRRGSSARHRARRRSPSWRQVTGCRPSVTRTSDDRRQAPAAARRGARRRPVVPGSRPRRPPPSGRGPLPRSRSRGPGTGGVGQSGEPAAQRRGLDEVEHRPAARDGLPAQRPVGVDRVRVADRLEHRQVGDRVAVGVARGEVVARCAAASSRMASALFGP